MAQTFNGHATVPKFTAPILASEHFIHRGSMSTLIGGQHGDRTLGDFLQLRMGANGEAEIGYADSNNVDESFAPHGMFVRQNGGTGLLAASSPVNIPGLTPFNTVSDPSGDGKYEVNGLSSANMPQLDILKSSIAKITTAPCSAAAPCYQVVMQLNNLTLAPTTTQDPDPDLVWLTQWLVPSTTDPNGGKNFFVYAESLNGGALQCFVGENAAQAVGGGVTLTYPGATQLPAANCLSTMGPNGTITIDVPLSDVNEPGAIDSRLHEVTASTMTLLHPANFVPSVSGIGGSLFNLIDVAQGYTFDSAVPTPTATPCPGEVDADGDEPGKKGGSAHFHAHHDDCGEQPESETFNDPSSGTDFHSTQVSSVTYDNVKHLVTIVGLGTNNGLPVTFTIVAVDSSLVPPGLFAITLSDGYSNSGNLLSGSITVRSP